VTEPRTAATLLMSLVTPTARCCQSRTSMPSPARQPAGAWVIWDAATVRIRLTASCLPSEATTSQQVTRRTVD
jgi:hypothetical protein